MRNSLSLLGRKIVKFKFQLIALLIFSISINLLLTHIGFFTLNIFGDHRNTAVEIKTHNAVSLTPKRDNDDIVYKNLDHCHNYFFDRPASDVISKELSEMRIVRGILIYYPADKNDYFEQEFKWLYRSWIEMQKYESPKWRTDFIVFADLNLINEHNLTVFRDLNCSIENRRVKREEKPMCTILNYIAVKSRVIEKSDKDFLASHSTDEIYELLYKKTDVFDDTPGNLGKFYAKLKELVTYNYLDSILMAFDGYSYYKKNFDFLLRSDIDTFLTPLFAKWLPKNCNDFIVGGGGYSHDFNMKRLRRAAKHLKLKFDDKRNLGSTWFATPQQVRLAAYYTLLSMVYISSEEFSESERQGKVGTILWPEWHYGVLLLYGQNLAMNHLISSKILNVTKLENLIDFPSENEESVFQKVHIHVYHGEGLFSKFMFRAGRYDNYSLENINTTRVKYYALNIALESKRKTSLELREMLKPIFENKN